MKEVHPRTAKTLKKRGVDWVIRPENVVIYCFGKAKSSAAYNQQATSNIISIVKDGKLPDGSKSEAFQNQMRIPGGDLTSYPELPEGKLTERETLSLFMLVLNDGIEVVTDAQHNTRKGVHFMVGRQWINATA